MPSAPEVWVGLLGPLVVLRQGSTELVRGPMQRIVLSTLCLEPGRLVTTRELVDRMWHGTPPPTAPSSLRVHIQHLRELLSTGAGNPIRFVGTGYALERHLVGTDAAEFRRLAAVVRGPGTPADRLADADRALALWRSDPFPDLLDDPAFAVAAEGLRETHETVAEDRTDILLRLGHHEVAVTDLVELVARDPLRERRSRLLMLALYRSGRQGEALAVYQSLRRRLRDELGIDPGEDTRRLEMDILRHARRLKLPGDTAGSLAPRAAAVGPHPDAAVRIMTAQRLAVLPDDVAALVRMMAVLDDLAEPAVLASALGWDRPRLDAASHEAHVHGLLNDGAGNLRLAVDIREGVLSGLHLPELARLNACAGRALASGHPTTERVARAAWHLLAGDAMNPATGTTVLDAMHRLLSDGQLEALRALGNRAITLTSGAVQRQYWPAIFEMLTEAGDAPGPEGAPEWGSPGSRAGQPMPRPG